MGAYAMFQNMGVVIFFFKIYFLFVSFEVLQDGKLIYTFL